jgi:hypothetical protein
MTPSPAVQGRVQQLQALAADIRSQCRSTASVDTASCASAAVAIDALIERMWNNNDPAKERRYLDAADRILSKFGDPARLVDGAQLGDLARDIAADAKAAAAIGGAGLLVALAIAGGVFLWLKSKESQDVVIVGR